MAELLRFIIMVLFILFLIMLFDGSADVWDKLHEHVMYELSKPKD